MKLRVMLDWLWWIVQVIWLVLTLLAMVAVRGVVKGARRLSGN